MRQIAIVLLLLCACASTSTPPATEGARSAPLPVPTASEPPHSVRPTDIAAKTAKMQKIDGFLPLFWDAEDGKLYLQIARIGEEMINVSSLPGGLGSNPVGLDRNEMGESRIVRFDRVGPKVLLV